MIINNQYIINFGKFVRIIILQMGNDQPPPKKQMSLDDAMIEMKIQSKQVMRAAKKAEKESEKYKKQAKDALKKNN